MKSDAKSAKSAVNTTDACEARMKPLVGWGLGGPCVRPRVAARLGEPAWSVQEELRQPLMHHVYDALIVMRDES